MNESLNENKAAGAPSALNERLGMEQPTEHELRIALRICKVFNQTPQRVGALQDLQRIRDRKTTWVGSEENALRVKIDKYIENGGGGFDA